MWLLKASDTLREHRHQWRRENKDASRQGIWGLSEMNNWFVLRGSSAAISPRLSSLVLPHTAVSSDGLSHDDKHCSTRYCNVSHRHGYNFTPPSLRPKYFRFMTRTSQPVKTVPLATLCPISYHSHWPVTPFVDQGTPITESSHKICRPQTVSLYNVHGEICTRLGTGPGHWQLNSKRSLSLTVHCFSWSEPWAIKTFTLTVTFLPTVLFELFS